MDPAGGGEDPFFEAILSGAEAAVAAEIDNTRLMRERLRVKRAELDAKERELEIRRRKKALVVASEEANEKLVRDFLDADNTRDFEKQNALRGAIAASVNSDVVKLVDAFVGGDAFKNSDDPKVMARALLAMVKPDSVNGFGTSVNIPDDGDFL